MVRINPEHLQNGSSLTKGILNNYFPGGSVRVNNTTASMRPASSLTIMQRDFSDPLRAAVKPGIDAIRVAYGTTNSSLNSTFASAIEMGRTIGSSITLPDKNSTDGYKTLTGSQAVNQLLADTSYVTNFNTGYVSRKTKTYLNDIIALEDAEIFTIDGANHTANEDNQSTSTAMASGGDRIIALESILSSEEISWYSARSAAAQATGSVYSGLQFDFDLPDNFVDTNLTVHGTYYPFAGTSANVNIPNSLIAAGVQKAWVSAALLEFLIYMASDQSNIDLSVGTGTSRANAANGGQGNNVSGLDPGETVTAHAFGRALDIFGIKSRDGTKGGRLDSIPPIDEYRVMFEMLCDEMNRMAETCPHLVPDLVGFHGGLGEEFGANADGLEGPETVVKQRWPNLRYVNFYAYSHENHIHVSWAPQRAGIYTGPDGEMGTPEVASPLPASSGDLSGLEGSSQLIFFDRNFTETYFNKRDDGLTLDQLFKLFDGTFTGPESAAVLAAIVQRESRGKMVVLNSNASSGDYSIAPLQLNMLKGAHGGKQYYLPFTRTGSMGRVEEGWKLAYAPWEEDGITLDDFDKERIKAGTSKMADIIDTYSNSELIDRTDPDIWIPINFAYMTFTVITSRTAPAVFTDTEKIATSPVDGHIFGPWGDWTNGPAYGWLTSIQWADVANVYVANGGRESDLKNHLLTVYSLSGVGSSSKSQPYVERWVNGWHFPGGYSGGHYALDPVPPQAVTVT